jgi:fatty-acyl-CoA synthase
MTPYSFPLLIKQLLVTPIAQRSNKQIVYRDQVRFDYPQLMTRIARLGSALSSIGVKAGDTVAVLDWDSNRYLECYFAIPMLGATLMKTNIRLSPEQIAYTLEHSEAETLLVHVDFVPVLQEIRNHLSHVKRIICLTDDGQTTKGLDWSDEYESLIAKGDPQHEFPDFDENTRATLYYTTGTTGAPKGVYFSHRQLVLHCLTVLATMSQASENAQHSRNDVYMPLTPMFHAHAWGYPYIATLCGWKQVYPGKFDGNHAARLALEEGVTFSHCVPTVLDMVLNSREAQGADFKQWKVLIGGSGLPRALATRALERNIDVYCGYGMSESCPLLTLAQVKTDTVSQVQDPKEKELDLRLTQGMPILMAQVRIVDPEMNSVPVDGSSVGEVVVRTPYLTQGYHANPQASSELWRGGWMHTGDIGRFDEDGYLHLVDRQKDVIKSGGEWISSIQLEDLITQHPGVREVAVIGVEDPKWGERPLALVVLNERESLVVDELKAHLRTFVDQGAISSFAIPDIFLFVEALAKTSVGKLDKKRLRDAYAYMNSNGNVGS